MLVDDPSFLIFAYILYLYLLYLYLNFDETYSAVVFAVLK